MLDTLLINIGQLLTMDQEDGLLRREAMNTLPVIERCGWNRKWCNYIRWNSRRSKRITSERSY